MSHRAFTCAKWAGVLFSSVLFSPPSHRTVDKDYGLKLSQVDFLWDSSSGRCGFSTWAAAAVSCDSLAVESQLLFWTQGEARSSHPLVEEHVRVGGQDLVQVGFADRVVRHPEPLGAVGWWASGWRRAAAVCDKMSRVHVAVVNQHGRELEEVLRGAGKEGDTIKVSNMHQLNWSLIFLTQ